MILLLNKLNGLFIELLMKFLCSDDDDDVNVCWWIFGFFIKFDEDALKKKKGRRWSFL